MDCDNKCSIIDYPDIQFAAPTFIRPLYKGRKAQFRIQWFSLLNELKANVFFQLTRVRMPLCHSPYIILTVRRYYYVLFALQVHMTCVKSALHTTVCHDVRKQPTQPV